MSTVYPDNILQTVQTFNKSDLALLRNESCMVHIANKKFKDFQNIEANLGSSVTFDTPPRFVTNNGLVWATQPAVQQVQTLTCSQAKNVSFAVTSQERLFNVDKGGGAENIGNYLDTFAYSGIAELGSEIESDVSLSFVSGMVNGQTGVTNVNSGPYRFYGDGSTPISSYQQLATMLMYYKNYGAVKTGIKVVVPDTIVPSVVGNGLNQFAPERNNEIAMSWMIGKFGTPPVEYYQSNLLPLHVSGNTGVNGQTLTVISTNDPTGQNVTQITLSGATASDALAVLSGDLFQFKDGVSGKPNMRYLTYIGHKPSANPVQIRATADAAADVSGNVTITITPALNWAGGQNKNLNNSITAGMQLLTFPSHRAGGVIGDDAFFLAMPKLPDVRPFFSAARMDDETGVSVRTSFGSLLGMNETRYGWDVIYGAQLVPQYSMRMLVPLSQS